MSKEHTLAAAHHSAASSDTHRRLRTLGWEASENTIFPSPIRHVTLRESALSHISVSAGRLTLLKDTDTRAPAAEFSQVRLLMVTRGVLTAHIGAARPLTLESGRAVVVERGTPLMLETVDDTRFFEYIVREGRLNDNGRLPLRRDHAYRIEHAAAAPFVALAGVNLANNADLSRASGAHVQIALDHTAAALFADQVSAPAATLTTGEAALIVRAGEVMDLHRETDGFTVQDLARELGISRMYLYRVMVKYGTTPSAFLHQASRR